jgi:hypothetical protein
LIERRGRINDYFSIYSFDSSDDVANRQIAADVISVIVTFGTMAALVIYWIGVFEA